MNINLIIKRAINLIVKPAEEWKAIEQENSSKNSALFGFAFPFIILISASAFAGSLIFLNFYFNISYVFINTVTSFIVPFVSIILSAIIINSMAPGFGSVKNIDNAYKLVIYSYIAVFLANIVTALLPALFFVEFTGLYSFFILYNGITPMMKTPEDKKVGYFILSGLIMLGVYTTLLYTLQLINSAIFWSGLGGNMLRF